MPNYNGNYVAPVWINNQPPPIDETEMRAMSQKIEASQILTGSGAPTQYVSGTVGQRYADTSTTPYTIYRLVTAAEDANVWALDDPNSNLAEEYDPTAYYDEGEFCIHNGVLYIALVDIDPPEPWTAEHWGQYYLANYARDTHDGLDGHESDVNNPHWVTKDQVGLENVDNVRQYSASNKPTAGDVTYDGTTSGLSATDVKGAVDELAAGKKDTQTAVTDPTASGTALEFIDSISQDAQGVITPTKKSVTVDATPTENSDNPVKSGGVYTALEGKADSDIMDYDTATASGAIVSFTADSAAPLVGLTVDIEPVQSGSGDPSPGNVRPISGWSAVNVWRTGKNLVKTKDSGRTNSYVTYTVDSDGCITAVGTASGSSWFRSGGEPTEYGTYLKAGTYKPSGGISSEKILYLIGAYVDGTSIVNSTVQGGVYDKGSGLTFTLLGDAYITYQVQITSGTICNDTFYPMIRLASETDNTFEPYSGNQYTIQLGQTVYGGTLDVTNGVLTVDRANIASYNGETLPGEWISDRDVYAPGTTPTIGAQVVYELATPIIYQLTPQQISTLLGANNIWADTGDSTVVYREGENALLRDVAAAVENLQGKLVWDSTPTAGSVNPVTSGGIKTALDGKVPTTRKVNGKALSSDITLTGADVAVPSGTITLSLSWSGSGPYTQTVTVSGATISSNSKVDLQPTPAQLAQLISDGVEAIVIENNAGTLTATAIGAAPSTAMTVQCTVTEVAA